MTKHMDFPILTDMTLGSGAYNPPPQIITYPTATPYTIISIEKYADLAKQNIELLIENRELRMQLEALKPAQEVQE